MWGVTRHHWHPWEGPAEVLGGMRGELNRREMLLVVAASTGRDVVQGLNRSLQVGPHAKRDLMTFYETVMSYRTLQKGSHCKSDPIGRCKRVPTARGTLLQRRPLGLFKALPVFPIYFATLTKVALTLPGAFLIFLLLFFPQQDELEFGYVEAPHKTFPVVFDSPRNRGLKDFAFKKILVCCHVANSPLSR